MLDEAAGDGVLEAIKGDADAFRTAVLLVEPGEPPMERALEALQRGVQDILVEPVRDAELVMRVQAAGRTKGLQEEMVAQAERLESLLFEDPLTGLTNRRFILTQLGRLGGEEFLALLPDVDGRTAGATTEKLRASVAPLDVSVSVGWAVWQGEPADELLRRADDALYTAKAGGRDCVVGAPATLARRK